MNIEKHDCDESNVPGINILFGPSIDSDYSGWVLVNKFYATEQDVRAGEAENVNEELSCSELAIKFCPFCGEKLNDQNKKT